MPNIQSWIMHHMHKLINPNRRIMPKLSDQLQDLLNQFKLQYM